VATWPRNVNRQQTFANVLLSRPDKPWLHRDVSRQLIASRRAHHGSGASLVTLLPLLGRSPEAASNGGLLFAAVVAYSFFAGHQQSVAKKCRGCMNEFAKSFGLDEPAKT